MDLYKVSNYLKTPLLFLKPFVYLNQIILLKLEMIIK